MNRRSFFKSLAAAAVLDPEKLLYIPGKVIYSIPRLSYLELRVFSELSIRNLGHKIPYAFLQNPVKVPNLVGKIPTLQVDHYPVKMEEFGTIINPRNLVGYLVRDAFFKKHEVVGQWNLIWK